MSVATSCRIHSGTAALGNTTANWDTRAMSNKLAVVFVSILRGTATPEMLANVVALIFYTTCISTAVLIGLGVMHQRGFRTRYAEMDELRPLDTRTHKRIAYKLSKKMAEKKASEGGCDTVWSESRFKEGMEENAWVIE